MKTHLTYCHIWGGGYTPIMEIARYISYVFWREKFNSFFEEFNLELYCMSDDKGSSVVMDEMFKETYKRLPIVRLYRRYKSIEVKLKAPEVTERIYKARKERLDNELYHFSSMPKKHAPSFVPERYKNLSDVDLSKMIIDRYLEAGRLIIKKLKPEDNFNHTRYEQILLRIKDSISDEFFKQMKTQIAIWERRDHIEGALKAREYRRTINRKKNKLIHAFRVFSMGLPSEALSPYDHDYEKIFCDVLRRKRLLCPGHNCLFIDVAANEEDALLNSPMEKWSLCNGISIFDYEKYKVLTEKDKKRTVFDIICRGLRDITELDKLDSTIIEEAIKEIEATTLNTELSSKVV